MSTESERITVLETHHERDVRDFRDFKGEVQGQFERVHEKIDCFDRKMTNGFKELKQVVNGVERESKCAVQAVTTDTKALSLKTKILWGASITIVGLLVTALLKYLIGGGLVG